MEDTARARRIRLSGVAAVIFDLDGTLVDSRADIAAAVNRGLRAVGAGERRDEEIHVLIGEPLVAIFEKLLGERAAGRAEEAARAFRAHYFDHCADRSRLYPGVAECLDALAGIPLAVATAKMTYMAKEVVRRLGIAGRFAVVQGSDGIPHKPHPAVLELAVRALGVEAKACWMVGDTPLDILAGRAAGMRTAAVTYGIGTEAALCAAAPDLVVGDPRDLPAALAPIP